MLLRNLVSVFLQTSSNLVSVRVSSSDTATLLACSGHLPLAKTLWSQVVKSGDIVIDATCGKGQDALSLANLALVGEKAQFGRLHCIDVQEKAIEATRQRLSSEFLNFESTKANIVFHCSSHETFQDEIADESVSLIVYNLGHFPVSRAESTSATDHHHHLITNTQTTLKSLNNSLKLIKHGGLLSVTAYRNHEGGTEESVAVREFMSEFDPLLWRAFIHEPMNRPLAPVVFTAFRNNKKIKSF